MHASKRYGIAIVLASALALAGCGILFPAAQQGSTEQVMSPVSGSPSDAAKPGSTPSAAVTTTAAAGTRTPVPPGTTATPGNANIDVTPADVTTSGVVMTLSFDTARHMYDQAAPSAGTPTDPAQQSQQNNKPATGSAVLPGGMLRVTNNFDAAQGAPADSAQAILRHAVLVIKTKDGQVVPYQAVTMDVLLDGRPVIFDQGLVAMVATDKTPPALYYGNNVKFPSRGTYQVFVRMQSNPLLGPDQPQAAQFNVTVH